MFLFSLIIILFDIYDFYTFINKQTNKINTYRGIDAIIVFTGGENRVQSGIDLISNNVGKRLFISGVNPDTNIFDISEQILSDEDLLNCCIDLGKKANNTIENAIESIDWIKNNNYKNVIIVTSNYHMKRSLFILKNFDRSINFIPHNVQSKFLQNKNIPIYAKMKTIISEYAKLTYTRIYFLIEKRIN
ncbi:MAG: YdcF family protein [Rhizobiales bacterium]|nr:YdcF family protein [Hyphomicrobiales bacterium]MBL6770077.1 YdcF family protein [Hyphomicrobiales bacterium]